MTFTGIYIIVFIIISELFRFKKINLGVIVGIIIPNLDTSLKYINIHTLYHGSILHSLIFIAIIYLLLLIVNQVNNNIVNREVVNGIFVGMLLHIIFDILLSVGPILIFWPLPIASTEPFYSLKVSNSILYLVTCLEFISLRYFGHRMIIKIVNSKDLPSESYRSINLIAYWIKFQTSILLLFIFMYLIGVKFSILLMDFCMFSSMTIALCFLYKTKELTKEDLIIG